MSWEVCVVYVYIEILIPGPAVFIVAAVLSTAGLELLQFLRDRLPHE